MNRSYLAFATLSLGLMAPGTAAAEADAAPGLSFHDGFVRDGRAKTLELLDSRRQAWRARAEDERLGRIDPACSTNPRPTYDDEKIYDDDEYGFRIHYTLDTTDSRHVTEDDVAETAAIMRFVIDTEHDDMGYLLPPDDTNDNLDYCDEGFGGNGGNGYYDVYFVDEDGIYGYAQPMSLVSSGSLRATSFLALSTWILDRPGDLEVTVAHEFFHAVQFSYDVFDEAFWMENTATWMEEQVYDDVNDYYNYLRYAFDNPDIRLTSEEIYMYAHSIWPLFMSEKLDPSIIQLIWEECAEDGNENAFPAQKLILDDAYEGGWEQAVLDFRGAMYNRAEFSEGDEYPSVKVSELVSSYPASGSMDVQNSAAKIITFPSTSAGVTDDTLTVCFKGGSDLTRAHIYARRASDRTPILQSFDGTDSDGCVSVENFGAEYDQLALVGSYLAVTRGTSSFTYAACVGEGDCEVGEPSTPVEEPTPTVDDGEGEVVLCGGCFVLESTDPEGRQGANLLFFGLQIFAGIFLLRRRPGR